jgi:1-acyl-sn-glycerol-3-phosphate acyltransferase
MTALRALVFWIGWVVWTVGLGVLGLPSFLLPRIWAVRVSRLWAAGTLAWLRLAVGMRHEIRGGAFRPAGPAIIALKHQSAWETLALACLFDDPAIVLKRELLSIPFFGWYLKGVGMIAIDRAAGAAALKQMVAQAKHAVAIGRPVAIFPEGTRSAVGTRQPYHPGVGALYSQLDLPILPVAHNSGLYWEKGFLKKRKGRIIVEFLPPIAPGMGRREAMQLLEERIESAADGLLREGRAPPVDKLVGKTPQSQP